MVRRLMLAAALVSSVAALFETCGCGSPIAVVQGTGVQFCPSAGYQQCNTTVLKESACSLSCDHPRGVLTYRNTSAPTIFRVATNITCQNGQYTTDRGEPVWASFTRPTCGVKYTCSACPLVESPVCATGMSCKAGNLVNALNEYGCSRASCKDGSLRLYDAASGAPLAWATQSLYCTTAGKWYNYSVDGSPGQNLAAPESFTANCVLPKACENCPNPIIATSLSQLPVAFRTGYQLTAPTNVKEAGACSTLTCAAPSVLYGWNSSTSTGTGLEYTNRGYGRCNAELQWTNGGQAIMPNNLITACLGPPAPPTTTAPPTTVWPCGFFDNFPLENGTYACVEGQTKVQCPAGQKIEIMTLDETLKFEQAVYVAGKGWLSYDCDGTARIWKTEGQIYGGICKA